MGDSILGPTWLFLTPEIAHILPFVFIYMHIIDLLVFYSCYKMNREPKKIMSFLSLGMYKDHLPCKLLTDSSIRRVKRGEKVAYGNSEVQPTLEAIMIFSTQYTFIFLLFICWNENSYIQQQRHYMQRFSRYPNVEDKKKH